MYLYFILCFYFSFVILINGGLVSLRRQFHVFLITHTHSFKLHIVFMVGCLFVMVFSNWGLTFWTMEFFVLKMAFLVVYGEHAEGSMTFDSVYPDYSG